MNFKVIATIAAILTLVNAAFFLFAPGLSLGLLAGSTDPTGLLMVRLSGACAFGPGVITWLGRNSKVYEVQRIVSAGNLVMFGLLIFVDLLGMVTHLLNAAGWLIFIADLFLLIGFLISIFTFRGDWT